MWRETQFIRLIRANGKFGDYVVYLLGSWRKKKVYCGLLWSESHWCIITQQNRSNNASIWFFTIVKSDLDLQTWARGAPFLRERPQRITAFSHIVSSATCITRGDRFPQPERVSSERRLSPISVVHTSCCSQLLRQHWFWVRLRPRK